jgi:hypothetical protein
MVLVFSAPTRGKRAAGREDQVSGLAASRKRLHIGQMATWTLVLMMFFKAPTGNIEPRGIASVPGYATEAECKSAGTQATENKLPFLNAQIHFMCIRGPKK